MAALDQRLFPYVRMILPGHAFVERFLKQHEPGVGLKSFQPGKQERATTFMPGNPAFLPGRLMMLTLGCCIANVMIGRQPRGVLRYQRTYLLDEPPVHEDG